MSALRPTPKVPSIISVLSGGVNPYSEAFERSKQKTDHQPAKIGGINIEVTVSVEAVANNWNRVINRLDREIDKYGQYNRRETGYLNEIIAPCPAYDGWTITLSFESIDDMNNNLERLRDKIERICNDKRK